MSIEIKALDLRTEFPASPRQMMGGYVHLARMRDKARAKAAGIIGEYIYPCPLDQRLLQFLGITGDSFYEAVQQYNDDQLIKWVKQNARRHRPEEIQKWNEEFLNRKPETGENLQRFLAMRNKVAPGRNDIETWIDLLDAEEGRPVPVSG